ncbi:MAG: MATE family efflux transporter, partial [Calditrichia bacterium]
MNGNVFQKLNQRISDENGYAGILKVALPLILSTSSWTLQQFIDRILLTWYSADAIAAALPASMVNWVFMSFFMGTAAYVDTFVAQYYGAEKYHRIGPAVWQGLYLSALSILIIPLLYPLTGSFFRLMNHPPAIQQMEADYFRILLFGAPLLSVTSAVTGFFAGRGKTWTVMWINFAAMLVNILLDYLLIFGNWGFPRMGIRGAGLGTVLAMGASAVLFLIMMLKPRFNEKYYTLKGWRFETPLFRRLIRYGAPSGLQFMLEITAFAVFTMLIGNLGDTELAASSIAFNINSLAFLPMWGMSIAVSVLVGQRLGDNRPADAAQVTWNAFHLALLFFGILVVGYLFLPGLFLLPYGWQADSAEFLPVRSVTIVLLRFVAFYSIFDALNMIFSAAIKGAGDTHFVAGVSVSCSWLLMLLP